MTEDNNLPDDHVHQWEFRYTSENFFDGDETDVYRCVADGCNAYKKKYIPR